MDPIALNIPTYFDVIQRKDARDLKLIRQKLENDKYASMEAFEADIDLMVNNAILFNGADSEVGKVAVLLRARVSEMMESIKSGHTRKRKETEKGNAQPHKKIKLV